MNEASSCIAVFTSHTEAETAIKALSKSGFDMTKLSIVARGYNREERVVGYYNAGERMKFWGSQGAFWGGVWGLLVGSAFFSIPGVGPIVVAGPIIASIVSTLEGALVFGGMSIVGAGLISLGIPKDSAIEFEASLSSGKYILVAHGTSAETSQARETIKDASPEIARIHIHSQSAIPLQKSATKRDAILL